MDQLPDLPITTEALRSLEATTGVRHEVVDGVPHAMSGGSAVHSRIKTNLVVAIGNRLRDTDCHVADSDQRIAVEMTRASFYPDISIICGTYRFAEDDDHAVTNPVTLIEVLSPSTESLDRGSKFQHYRRIPSMDQYVLVSQDERRIEVFRRTERGWLLDEYTDGSLELEPNVSIPFDQIYDLKNIPGV